MKCLWRGSFLPVCQQKSKTKALCFPKSKLEEGQKPELPLSVTSLGQPTVGRPNQAKLTRTRSTRPVRTYLYLVLISMNRVSWGAINVIFKRGRVWRLVYAFPVVSRGHHEAFVFTMFAMGKYLKQIGRMVCTHQCKNTSKCGGLCWQGVAQCWRSYLFTLAVSENLKKKGNYFLSEIVDKQNEYSWTDKWAGKSRLRSCSSMPDLVWEGGWQFGVLPHSITTVIIVIITEVSATTLELKWRKHFSSCKQIIIIMLGMRNLNTHRFQGTGNWPDLSPSEF